MKKMLSTINVTLLTAVILMTAFAVVPTAVAREVIDIIVICPFGPANCAIGTIDGVPTTWQVGAIVIT